MSSIKVVCFMKELGGISSPPFHQQGTCDLVGEFLIPPDLHEANSFIMVVASWHWLEDSVISKFKIVLLIEP